MFQKEEAPDCLSADRGFRAVPRPLGKQRGSRRSPTPIRIAMFQKEEARLRGEPGFKSPLKNSAATGKNRDEGPKLLPRT
jgi:hypothetical protein